MYDDKQGGHTNNTTVCALMCITTLVVMFIFALMYNHKYIEDHAVKELKCDCICVNHKTLKPEEAK